MRDGSEVMSLNSPSLGPCVAYWNAYSDKESCWKYNWIKGLRTDFMADRDFPRIRAPLQWRCKGRSKIDEWRVNEVNCGHSIDIDHDGALSFAINSDTGRITWLSLLIWRHWPGDARYTDINNCHDTSYYYCDGIYYEIIRNIMFSKAKREFRCNKL